MDTCGVLDADEAGMEEKRTLDYAARKHMGWMTPGLGLVWQTQCGLVRRLFEWQGGDAMKTDLLKRITIEPGKCGGSPCIRGMRIRVTDILQLLSAGASYEEILEDYPDLQRDDILAAIEYAAHQTYHAVLQAV